METIKDIEGKGRYLTKGVDIELHLNLQILLWTILNEYKNKKILEDKKEEIDPFQIFEISKEERALKIRHKQEQPSYERVLMIYDKELYNRQEKLGSIYIVNSENNSMIMMWNWEY